jgi:signal transduction histidine kinase
MKSLRGLRASGKDNVEVVFSHDGCGMSLGVKRQAFDPFFTTRRDQGGTGLGLQIVYNIVTNCLGGRLKLDSEPGEGTKIRIICRASRLQIRAGAGLAWIDG